MGAHLEDEAVWPAIRNETKTSRHVTPGMRVLRLLSGRRHGIGWPVERWLRAFLPRIPAEVVASWVAQGFVRVGGAVAAPGTIVAALTAVDADIPFPAAEVAAPPLELLFHDGWMALANKPVGQLAHPAGKDLAGTLLGQLQTWAAERGVAASEVRLVNRIDRETSGIVLASLSLLAHQRLAAAMDAGAFRKAYRAICRGVPAPAEGIWDAPIAGEGPHTIRRCVRADGQPSRTRYRVVAVAQTAMGPFSLLQLELETGRQHQIRVHATHHGHPLVGDWVYGEPCAGLAGQALHAAELDLPHPDDGRIVRIAAPLTPALDAIWSGLLRGTVPEPAQRTEEQRRKLGWG